MYRKNMVEVLPWSPKPDDFAIVRTPLFSVLELRPLDLQRISFFEVSLSPCMFLTEFLLMILLLLLLLWLF